jgi:hypothetical protein
MCSVGQSRVYRPSVTVYLVISLPKLPYVHHIYMVLANSRHMRLKLILRKYPAVALLFYCRVKDEIAWLREHKEGKMRMKKKHCCFGCCGGG